MSCEHPALTDAAPVIPESERPVRNNSVGWRREGTRNLVLPRPANGRNRRYSRVIAAFSFMNPWQTCHRGGIRIPSGCTEAYLPGIAGFCQETFDHEKNRPRLVIPVCHGLQFYHA